MSNKAIKILKEIISLDISTFNWENTYASATIGNGAWIPSDGPKIHFTEEGTHVLLLEPLCGAYMHKYHRTDNVTEVTCKKCVARLRKDKQLVQASLKKYFPTILSNKIDSAIYHIKSELECAEQNEKVKIEKQKDVIARRLEISQPIVQKIEKAVKQFLKAYEERHLSYGEMIELRHLSDRHILTEMLPVKFIYFGKADGYKALFLFNTELEKIYTYII